MKKSLFDLAIEYTGHDKINLTEFQENEIDAFVQFGKRVMENAAQQSVQRTCFYCDENKAPAKEAICQSCVDLLSDASR